jgi:hypothetical protein
MGVQINGDTGNISATKADYSGNVTIGGTLTYEDVTNVDSIGIVTARNGIEVGARPGVAASVSVDGNAIFSGITTIGGDAKVGSGVTLSPDGNIFTTGIATVSGGSSMADGVRAQFGTSGDMQIFHNGSNSYVEASGTGALYLIGNNNDDVQIQPRSGYNSGRFKPNGAVELYHDNSKKLETASGGVTVTGTVAATAFTGDGSALTGVSAGITVAQQFRLAADQAGSGSAGTVLTNWEESDTDYQRIGSTVWSQSSGVFSCSATGIYLCMWTLVVNDTSTGDAYDPNIQISTDSGSNWDIRSRSWAHISNGTVNRASPQNQFIFDVSNTSTFRLRYRQSAANDLASQTTIAGSTSENLTNILFIRLGDT